MAKPMIFSEETGPTHFTFANQVGVQTNESTTDGSTPDELARTIQSHLWLANLEISSGCAPAWSANVANSQGSSSRWSIHHDLASARRCP